MSDLRDHGFLYARSSGVLGPEPVEILMQQLPPESELAARSDGAEIVTRMDRIEHLRERFDERLHDFLGARREPTRSFILATSGTMVTFVGGALAGGGAAVSPWCGQPADATVAV